MKLQDKIAAREWILNAIQNHSCIPTKGAKHEIQRFIKRLQRDLTQLYSQKEAIKLVQESELKRLSKAQSADEADRRLRFILK